MISSLPRLLYIMSDEETTTFMSLTGATSDVAQVYLDFSGGNAASAVDLYFNDPTLANGQGQESASMQTTDETPKFTTKDPTISADALLAKSLMEEDAANSAPQIRRPDAAKKDVLMGGGSYDGGMGGMMMGGVGGANMMGMGVNGAFMPPPPTATWDGDEPEGTAKNKKDKNLKDMFAPPTNLMYVGPFQTARQAAKESKRWLMINIQRDSDFASHALNRDVWSSETVESVVKTGFIFWQMMEEREEGRIYCERYNVTSFPHIAFLDPRTGRSMWSKEGWSMENPVTAETFLESVVDFCDRNSFDRPPSAPKVERGGEKKQRVGSIEDASESDQMEAAIRASLSEGGARIAFKLPKGRVMRKFPGDTVIGQVFAFVKEEVKMEEAGKKEFELR
ncbi:hypothetical protein TL16_g10234 [Triparma laevis f. inornata]|uniref:UAS domain-containing protein n=1 Tax=Triparma laevis f. inornata TaxID=1714386 RepID=A0A9W7EPP6_9STRA|nr:hypothetical protein TL16_g10234 [Triparma laevis f. inornata]